MLKPKCHHALEKQKPHDKKQETSFLN